MLGPVKDRVAPALAGLAEIIRRYSGHENGPLGAVELEQFGMGPDIGAVLGHVDGQVADELHVVLPAVAAQGPPLAERQVLAEAHAVQGVLGLVAQGVDGPGFPVAQGHGPVGPTRAALPGLGHPEQRVVVEPARLLPAELPEADIPVQPLLGPGKGKIDQPVLEHLGRRMWGVECQGILDKNRFLVHFERNCA